MQGSFIGFLASDMLVAIAIYGLGMLLPLTQGIKLLKGFSLGLDIGGLLTPLIIMGGLAIICILASVRLFKWE